MPLFVCSNCGCVENTALGEYHWRKAEKKPVLCSECGKGKWHGKFEKEKHDGIFDMNFMEFVEVLGFNAPGTYTIEELKAMKK